MTGTKPLIDVKTLRFALIETADECRELGMQHPADDHLRGTYLRTAAQLYRAARQEGAALLCEELL